jgi:hypothetical protein
VAPLQGARDISLAGKWEAALDLHRSGFPQIFNMDCSVGEKGCDFTNAVVVHDFNFFDAVFVYVVAAGNGISKKHHENDFRNGGRPQSK